MENSAPASVTITRLIIDSLPILIPLLFAGVGTLMLQMKRLAVAVDGKVSALIAKVEEKSVLEAEVASLKAMILGIESGRKDAETTAKLQAAEVAVARAMPPLVDSNGETLPHTPDAPSSGQGDRIEKTGEDTNTRAQNIETHVQQRVQKVEDKLDAQEKEKT